MTPDSPAPVPPDGEKWDASNCVRFCDRCDAEYGITAGADAGDDACAGCGNLTAPHIYPHPRFAAGRAAASPDPPDMTNMCEGESPDHKPGITPAASPDERLREAGEQLANLVTLLGGYDGPGYLAAPNQGEHPDYYAAAKLFDRIMRDEKTGAAVVLAQWRAALAAADREAPDEGGGAMSEFRVVDANGDPYPPHAQPCRTLAAAALRRDFYSKILSVSGEARMPVKPLRIERRSMVVSMWEPWNVGAAPGVNTRGVRDE